MSDPLDELGISRVDDAARFEEPSDPPPQGYGHIPQNPASRISDPYPIARAQIRREVFWQNVCREILMALSNAASSSEPRPAEPSGRLGPAPAEHLKSAPGENSQPAPEPSPDQPSVSPLAEIFDGRMGVITSLGQRIPIANVFPVFSFSMSGCDEDRSRSNDVQCTVFRITTPTGETYTLPINQIVGVHTLSASLIEKLEAAQNEGEGDEEKVPFGFSAYTSMARSEQQAQQAQQQQDQQPPHEPPAAPSGPKETPPGSPPPSP